MASNNGTPYKPLPQEPVIPTNPTDKDNGTTSKHTSSTQKTGTGANRTTIIRYGGSNDEDLTSVILTWFIQVTGLAAAVTFGVFSVLSWTVTHDAKNQAATAASQADTAIRQGNTAIEQAHAASQQAAAANLLALAALCSNSGNNGTQFNDEVRDFCSQVFPYAWTPLASAARSMFPNIGTVTPPPSSSVSFPGTSITSSTTPTSSSIPTSGGSETSGAGLETPGAAVALGVGLGIGLIVLFVTTLTVLRWRRKKKQYESREYQDALIVTPNDSLVRELQS